MSELKRTPLYDAHVAAGATIATRELAEAEDYDTIRTNAENHTRHIR